MPFVGWFIKSAEYTLWSQVLLTQTLISWNICLSQLGISLPRRSFQASKLCSVTQGSESSNYLFLVFWSLSYWVLTVYISLTVVDCFFLFCHTLYHALHLWNLHQLYPYFMDIVYAPCKLVKLQSSLNTHKETDYSNGEITINAMIPSEWLEN